MRLRPNTGLSRLYAFAQYRLVQYHFRQYRYRQNHFRQYHSDSTVFDGPISTQKRFRQLFAAIQTVTVYYVRIPISIVFAGEYLCEGLCKAVLLT